VKMLSMADQIGSGSNYSEINAVAHSSFRIIGI
jgi:hypothetical protein